MYSFTIAAIVLVISLFSSSCFAWNYTIYYKHYNELGGKRGGWESLIGCEKHRERKILELNAAGVKYKIGPCN